MASLRPILVVGSSGHAKVAIDAIERGGAYRIAGLIDAFRQAGETAFGYPVLGTEERVHEIARAEGAEAGFVAIGDNWQRSRVVARILERLPEFEFVTVAHPSAQVARGAALGRGSILMAGAIVNADARIGEFCIVNTGASLDHDSVMGDYSSLAPGATTGGRVRIGEFSAIGLGAKVIHGCAIGEHAVVGAGALVLSDLPGHCVAYGVPAEVVRGRSAGETYLHDR